MTIEYKGDSISPFIQPQIEMPILTDYLNESESVQEVQRKWRKYIDSCNNNLEIEFIEMETPNTNIVVNNEEELNLFIPIELIDNVEDLPLKEDSVGVLLTDVKFISCRNVSKL